MTFLHEYDGFVVCNFFSYILVYSFELILTIQYRIIKRQSLAIFEILNSLFICIYYFLLGHYRNSIGKNKVGSLHICILLLQQMRHSPQRRTNGNYFTSCWNSFNFIIFTFASKNACLIKLIFEKRLQLKLILLLL